VQEDIQVSKVQAKSQQEVIAVLQTNYQRRDNHEDYPSRKDNHEK